MSFLHGLAIGAAMLIFIGPVFFTLLDSALKRGFRGGLSVANGIIVSDIVAIVICYYAAGRFIDINEIGPIMAILGGFILVGMGLKYILAKPSLEPVNTELSIKNKTGLFMKGFLVNFVNPFVFIVWIGMIAYGKEDYGEGSAFNVFILGSLFGIYGTDTLKAYFAAKLERFLKPAILSRINKAIGIFLILFSFRMFWWAWSNV